MDLLNAAREGIGTVLDWLKETIPALFDWGLTGPSEEIIILMTLFLIGKSILKAIRNK